MLLARQLRYGAQDRDRAERVLRRAVRGTPATSGLASNWPGAGLGVEFGSVRELYPHSEDAVRQLTAAVAIRPGSASTHTQLGIALHSHGKFDEAIAEHRAAIRLRPDFASAHGNLGIVLVAQGRLTRLSPSSGRRSGSNRTQPTTT